MSDTKTHRFFVQYRVKRGWRRDFEVPTSDPDAARAEVAKRGGPKAHMLCVYATAS